MSLLCIQGFTLVKLPYFLISFLEVLANLVTSTLAILDGGVKCLCEKTGLAVEVSNNSMGFLICKLIIFDLALTGGEV